MQEGKVLKTNHTDKWVSGVIGGLCRKLGIEPTIPRLLFLGVTVFSMGSLVIFYFILAMIMPSEPESPL